MFKRTPQGVVFAMVMDSYGKWAFPKGHVKPRERYREAAVREIKEEMGLSGLRYHARLGTIDIWFRDRFVHKGELIHKYIHYFLFEAPSHAVVTIPEHTGEGENIRDVAWVPADELLGRSSYRDMIGIIKKAMRICGLSFSKTSKPWERKVK